MKPWTPDMWIVAIEVATFAHKKRDERWILNWIANLRPRNMAAMLGVAWRVIDGIKAGRKPFPFRFGFGLRQLPLWLLDEIPLEKGAAK